MLFLQLKKNVYTHIQGFISLYFDIFNFFFSMLIYLQVQKKKYGLKEIQKKKGTDKKLLQSSLIAKPFFFFGFAAFQQSNTYKNPSEENLLFLSFFLFKKIKIKMTPTEKKDENFVRVVSFDAMTNTDLPDYSFTLRGKSTGFKRTRRSRTFMVATDLANYSEYALTWATDVKV